MAAPAENLPGPFDVLAKLGSLVRNHFQNLVDHVLGLLHVLGFIATTQDGYRNKVVALQCADGNRGDLPDPEP